MTRCLPALVPETAGAIAWRATAAATPCRGGSGTDRLSPGGAGNDRLSGGRGRDRLSGGPGPRSRRQ